MSDPRLRELLVRYVEEHTRSGRGPAPEILCAECPEFVEPLRDAIRDFERLDETLSLPAGPAGPEGATPLPQFAGFRTIERLGRGGGGEVYKVQDLALGRTVAAKVIRKDGALRAGLAEFLQEARTQALFADPCVATVYEFRAQADPPVLLMEYVDGFELGEIGRSLEYARRARVMAEIAETVERAHRLGVQHRDLKPQNIMLDAGLRPKILDFGLTADDPARGHGVGTPAYMAPEQLDPGRPIDARADVWALGVILYELLCGVPPFTGQTTDEVVANVRRASPRLPVEIEPDVPEPLQAIALQALEPDPAERYATAAELAADLRRWLEGRPVLARPGLYRAALERRIGAHVEQVREWRRIRLIHAHEAERLEQAYEPLRAHDEDWIVRGRSLTFSQIALYLGALLLGAGGVFYVTAWFLDAVHGLVAPTLVLALPFVVLNVAAMRLRARGGPAVAVAFHVAALLLLPLYMLIAFQETGFAPAAPGDGTELFGEGLPSNRQLQIALLAACAWAGWLALRTRTLTLGVAFTALLFLFDLALLGDFGLRNWLEEGPQWNLLALHHLPLLAALVLLGRTSEARALPTLARPLYFAALGLLVVVLELLALDGKAFAYLGLTMAPVQGPDVSDPTLLDTVAAMTANGILIYAAGWLLEHRGSPLLRRCAWLPYVLSPFAILYPLSHLVATGEYSRRFDWLYLASALAVVVLSHFRERRSFYYAGLLNTALALWLVTDHHEWFDAPAWAVLLALVGLVVLFAGLALHLRERERRPPG